MGPWRGELGFEALYWLPWLAQLRHELNIAPERMIPFTRGGAGVFYGDKYGSGPELYDFRAPQAVRIENRIQHARTGLLKQTHWTAFDRALVKEVLKGVTGQRCMTLHPSWMYQTMRPFWDAEKGLSWAQDRLRFDILQPPALDIQLPAAFAVARFYARSTWPPSPQTASVATETIKQMASKVPVILLNSGIHADEHVDFTPKETIPNVYQLKDLYPLTPQNNLAVQGAVIARSMGFVGTYGGLAQLALRFRKPVLSLFTDWYGTALPHRHLSEALALQMGVPFHVLRLADVPFIQDALPRFIVQHAGSSSAQPVGDQIPQPVYNST